ncbi:MAG: class I SAM-dependent methyltransferase [Lachnospiraceae bacterium]|nr:class I SAM-dependent methyltransferase [Lachnospiraceae bacterium]
MNLYIYGTGCGAGDLIDSALPLEKVAGFVESAPEKRTFMGKPVLSPEELAKKEYDLVLITSRAASAIKARCVQAGLHADKLFFLKSHTEIRDRNKCYEMAKEALGDAYVKKIQAGNRVISTLSYGQEQLPAEDYENDYVRVRTLELLAARLGDVPGVIAELGVYRGNFARLLNRLFPTRRLYLFDTFEGFDPKELAAEAREKGNAADHTLLSDSEGVKTGEPLLTTRAGLAAAHQNTCMNLVRDALPYPEQALFYPGLFPQTARGLEERFALVSLDVDLEDSTLAGLHFFYPRLTKGGVLLLHDYGNEKLPGVKRAALRYEAEIGERLSAVPLCDRNGTLVVMGK